MSDGPKSFLDRVKALHLGMPAGWSGTTKHIVTVLFSFANSADGSGIYASIGTIARHAGEQERTVERVIRLLREGEYLVDNGWRMLQRQSGDRVRVKTRRLVLSKITRNDQSAPNLETDTDDGFAAPIEHDTDGGLDAGETDTDDGFDPRPEEIETDIRGTADQIETDIGGTKSPIETDTGDTQTKSINRSKKDEPRERRARATRDPFGDSSSTTRKAPRKERSARKPETAIDPSWQPDEAGRAFAASKGVTDLVAEVEKFINRHLAHDERRRDWAASWRTWCGNHPRFGQRSNAAPGVGTSKTPAGQWAERYAARDKIAWTRGQSDAGDPADTLTIDGEIIP